MANRIVLKSTNPVTNISAAISTGAAGATGASGAGGATIADGDLGDIIVSASGTVMTIDTAAVTTAKLATNAVTTVKITDANVTAAKLASNAVTSANTDDTYEATLHDATLLTGVAAYARLPAGVTVKVYSQVVTGYWPSSYAADGTPTYGSSQSTGTRPTSRADLTIEWVQVVADGLFPPGVGSGTAGMRNGVDFKAKVS